MPALLISSLMKFVPWILAGLILIGGIIYVYHLQDALHMANAEVATATATINQLDVTNKQNLLALKTLQARSLAWQTALSSTMDDDARGASFTDELLSEAAVSSAKNDAPVAPVLARTLEAIAVHQEAKP